MCWKNPPDKDPCLLTYAEAVMLAFSANQYTKHPIRGRKINSVGINGETDEGKRVETGNRQKMLAGAANGRGGNEPRLMGHTER